MIKKKDVKETTVIPIDSKRILKPLTKKNKSGLREVKYKVYRLKGDLL